MNNRSGNKMVEMITKAVNKVSHMSDRLGLGLYVEFQPGKPEVRFNKWANGDKTGKLGWVFWAKSKRPDKR